MADVRRPACAGDGSPTRRRRWPPLTIVAVILLGGAASPGSAQSDKMSFFVTSQGRGKGGDLGGVQGADDHCAMLAYRVGAGDLTWRAYLSAPAAEGKPAVNARDRIGPGPWHNFDGVLIAETVAALHAEDNGIAKETALTERGTVVTGHGDATSLHEILTGSRPDGTAFPGTDDTTCNRWTSSGAGSARVGHHDRWAGGDSLSSWNSAGSTKGCSPAQLEEGGGKGLLYCFGFR